MADAPNGLASMTQARERRARRAMPPPRHPVPAGSAEPIHPGPRETPLAETPSEDTQPADRQPAATPRQGKASKSAPNSEAATSTAVGEESPPRPATLYLDSNLLEFLDEARIAGLVSRPRLDISKSAVVRLALRRLQQDMTIDEIREYLRAQPTDPTKTGRKRR